MATYDLTKGGLAPDWPNRMYAELPSTEVGPYEFMEAAAHFRPTQLTINRYLWFGGNNYYANMDYEANHSPSLAAFMRNLRASGRTITTADVLRVITLPIDHVAERIFIRNMNPMPGFAINVTIRDKDEDVIFDAGTFDLSLPHLDFNPETGAYTENTIQPIWVPSSTAASQDNAVEQAQAQLDALQAQLATAQTALTNAQAASTAAGGDAGATVTAAEQQAIDTAQAQVDTLTAQVDAAQDALNEAQTPAAGTTDSGYGLYLGHNHELCIQFTAIPDGANPLSGSCLGGGPCIDNLKLIIACQLNHPWLGAW